ncbi:MAG TPA: hypothetical protein ENK89_00400 [Desulfobulbaceae bacterium]|nr:hypothetical protein [Desulfobulbaceae bacterium]
MTEKKVSSTGDLSTLMHPYLPSVKRYVANRLRMAVIDGILTRGKYRVEDITDEVYIKLKEEFDGGRLPFDQIKLKMFMLADRQLEEILAEEYVHGEDVSVEEIVAGEMKTLEEKYVAEADGDLVLYEELDDVSYQHDQEQKTVYLLEPGFESDLITALDLEKSCAETADARKILAGTYQRLPSLTTIIIDLHVAGGLNAGEIAEIRNMDARDVDKIIRRVKVHFVTALKG